MSHQTPRETIQLLVLDSVLFGMARALDYLDVKGQVMMDKIGEGILEYCFKTGSIEKSGDPQELSNRIADFFTRNGYVGGVKIEQAGDQFAVTMTDWQYIGLMKRLRQQESYLLACPLCLASNAVFRSNGIYGQIVYEEMAPDGAFLRRYKMTPGSTVSTPESLIPPKLTNLGSVRYDGGVKVGTPAFEAVEYGLARSFDYLGAQARVLLDGVGHGIIEFLQAEAELTLTGNIAKDLDVVSSLFKSRGLADEIQCSISSSGATASFMNYRYEPVLRLLLDEGIQLVSCPFTLAAMAVLRNAGWTVGEMKWHLLGNRDCRLTMPLMKGADQQFDEEKIGAMMDEV